MRALLLEGPGDSLHIVDIPEPAPGPMEILIRIRACGLCRTDLHIIDADLPKPRLPLILGHQVIGEVAEVGEKVTTLRTGDLVGVPWLASTCGSCEYCLRDQENL